MSEQRTREVRISCPTGNPFDPDVKVEIDGHNMAKHLTAALYELRAGELATLRLEYEALNLTEIGGRAAVRIYIGGQEFTDEDLDSLRAAVHQTDERLAAGAEAVLERFAKLFPPAPTEPPA